MQVLITGGVRSGKSRFALYSALSYSPPRIFLATAEPLDQEMRERILRHQRERKDQFVTIEEPIHLAEKILQIDPPHPNPLPQGEGRVRDNPSVIIVDCLTIWLGNLFHHFGKNGFAIQNQVDRLIEVVKNVQGNIMIVTNEIGLGVIPGEAIGRRFVDTLGILNQELARICDEVVFMSCGIPQIIKGTLQNAKLDDRVTAH